MSFEPTRTPIEDALSRVDLGRVRAQIVKYASYRARSVDHGRELAQKALVEAIDPHGSPWDPGREPDLLRHLVGRVNGALAVERKKARLRAAPRIVAAVIHGLYRPAPTPAEALDERRRHEHYERAWAALRESFAGPGDALARGILDQYEAGVSGAAEQARALGAAAGDVYGERRRIARRARAMRDADYDGAHAHEAVAMAYATDDEASP